MHFAKATPPPAFHAAGWWWAPLLLGLLNAALAVTQLASFEDFRAILEAYGFIPNAWSATVALGIAALEILSLPVLLRLSLSPAMRTVSMYAVLAAPIAWIKLSIAAAATGNGASESGLFGSFVVVNADMLPFLSFVHLLVSVGVLYVFGLSGLAPRLKKKRRT